MQELERVESSKPQRRCRGLTGKNLLRWCERRGDWLLFCYEHKRHWILYLILGFAIGDGIVRIWEVSSYLRAPSRAELELLASAYTDISLACHRWKNVYMGVFPDVAPGTFPDKAYQNVWDRLREEPKPRFSEENWVRFRPLFEQYLNRVIQELQVAHSTYGDILPAKVRSHLRAVQQQLSLEQSGYRFIADRNLPEESANILRTDDGYAHLFETVIRQLEGLDREVQALRDEVNERLD